MSQFLRLLDIDNKAVALQTVCARLRLGERDSRAFHVSPDAFNAVPGKPFAYWVSDAVRETFRRLPPFESEGRTVRVGLQTSDDFRFVRGWWEIASRGTKVKWPPFAKGGAYSPFYADVYLVVNWETDGAEIYNFYDLKTGKLNSRPQNTDFYFRPGFTWSYRPSSKGSFRLLPKGIVFSVNGSSGFVENDDEPNIYASTGITNSTPYNFLIRLLFSRGGTSGGQTLTYEVGYVATTPCPFVPATQKVRLAALVRRAWSLKRNLDTVTETSHAFLLPLALRQAQAERLGAFDPPAIEAELASIQAEIDDIAFELYGFSDTDRAEALGASGSQASDDDIVNDLDAEGDEGDEAIDDTTSGDRLLSWAIGVAFGRFDIRLATGERAAPPEPEPFDPLPTKSPGMLPDGDPPFHAHPGILVDDPGHPHDLVRIVERVLDRVEMPVPAELRRWLQKDFFPFHLQRYSKSRRKAPIYWPLATASGSYTLWLFYPNLTGQTLYTAINDFVEPKLAEVEAEAANLRTKGSARSRDEEKRLEALATLEADLRDLRDQLLAIAPKYKPSHDDGVQITAAPLWPLFRHKPWQKVLKDTWAKLEKGDYDWAHLAMNYWPERVREKCKHDKSLAIAHGLEELYEEPTAAPKKVRGRKMAGVEE